MNGNLPFVVFGDAWGPHPVSMQHIVVRLARAHPLLYVNTFGLRRPRLTAYDARLAWQKIRDWSSPKTGARAGGIYNVHYCSPFLLPFNNIGSVRRWNRRMVVRAVRRELKEHDIDSPVLMVSYPSGAEAVGGLNERLLIYYIMDQYAELPGVDREYVADLEKILLARADLVFVTSRELQREKNGEKAPAVLLPHGVDFEHFHSAVNPQGPAPKELSRLPRPLLGFFGLVAPWVDADLLDHVARAFPQASVVLIGPAWFDRPMASARSNVHWLGPRTYAELPRYAAHFDVGLIPFRRDRLTSYVNPLKLLEYLALGLPVVSTPLPDLASFKGLVHEAETADDFTDLIGVALAEGTPEHRKERFARASKESWDARVSTLLQHIKSALRARTCS